MGQVDVQWPSEDEDFDPKIGELVAKQQTGDQAGSEPTKIVPAEPETEVEPEQEASVESEPTSQAAEVEAAPSVTEPAEEELLLPAQATPDKPAKVKQPRKPIMRTIVEVILVLALIGLGLWSWTLYGDRNDLRKQVAQLNANPEIAIQKQTQDLINQVGAHIQLPTGETPTIANVSDAAQAKQQSSFFDNAQNGDKVLMYVKAGEAILYRPSTDKIVLVAPLTFTNTGSTGSTSTPSSTSKTPTSSSTKP